MLSPVLLSLMLAELPSPPPLPALPKGFPELTAPADNPTTAEKAELGWMLFFDKRLSKDGTMACEQCHHIEKAYTSGLAVDPKVGGAMNKRNAPQMLNLGWHKHITWDGRLPSLEVASGAAMKNQMGADPAAVAKSLNAVPAYKQRFDRAFGGTEGATPDTISKALAAFLRSNHSANSPWDKFIVGDKKALSKEAQQGWEVFQKAQCTFCHVPPLFSDTDFHFIGLKSDDGGRKDATKAEEDAGKFKTPSLRNVALSAPYFHDGQTKTLEEAIAFMASGGGGAANVDPKLKPYKLSKKDAAALKAFLEGLTGESTWTKAPALP